MSFPKHLDCEGYIVFDIIGGGCCSNICFSPHKLFLIPRGLVWIKNGMIMTPLVNLILLHNGIIKSYLNDETNDF